MAFRHGKYAEIVVNSIPLTLYCDTADFSVDIDTADVTTFTHHWKRAIAGLAGGEVSLSGSWDPTASTGPAAVLTALIGTDAFPVVVYPGGNIAGQLSRTFNAILSNYTEHSEVGDKVGFEATLLVDDDVTFGTVGA